MGEQRLEVLSIGETLIDLISDTEQGSLGEARSFHMYPGGQATNVALNVARLGASAALVARVGDDTFGSYLRHHLEASGVGTTYLHTTPQTPTTLVVVTRHSMTPDFVVYRGADAQMVPGDMPLSLLSRTSLVHTSAFALSREPSCSTVLDFVKRAHEDGCLISFDPNYHPRLWEMHNDPASVFARIGPYVSLAKPSLDDCIRLFGAGQTPESYAAHFLAWGAQQVVLTMGSAGVLLANAAGTSYFPTHQVEVVDVTGAGDSFWAGLLLATLDGYAIHEAIRAAQAVAAIKVQQVGPLSQTIDRAALYARIGLQKEES
ncbi:MAG: sugar kinase [Chloroflexota bacterium]|nr:sugar kinase [Chloroflexota bacterium]